FGPLALSTIFGPYLALIEASPKRRGLSGVAVFLGTGGIWGLACAFGDSISVASCLNCVLLLGAWIAMLYGLAILLNALGLVEWVGCPTVVLAGLISLTWPIWLSGWLSGRSGESIVGWLVRFHPLFAMNGV